MHCTQAFSLLPLFLLTPLTLAAPAAEPQNPPPNSCLLGRTPYNCREPDRQTVEPSFLGFQGHFTGVGFSYLYFLPDDPAHIVPSIICPLRVDDTVRRALASERVAQNYFQYVDPNGPIKGDPQTLIRCKDATTPIFQGTTYIGNHQIFVTYDANTNPSPEGQTVTYCGYSSGPTPYDATEQFVPGCSIPVLPPSPPIPQ
ncbi:hypothetical protein IWX90DRAFT_511728 [Phyllosticta citrichinensis]|uniref:Uncharacterized protein n=1 Tax=Phyllosticta citrichinensis TaxID=1130410 RepID=A0ABR1XYH5_9PEZI